MVIPAPDSMGISMITAKPSMLVRSASVLDEELRTRACGGEAVGARDHLAFPGLSSARWDTPMEKMRKGTRIESGSMPAQDRECAQQPQHRHHRDDQGHRSVSFTSSRTRRSA
jgi:hypothetical protein